MKILCLFQFFTTGRTPGSIRPFRLCKLLAEKGHDVIVISTDFNFASGESEGPSYEKIETTGKRITIHRISSDPNFRKSLYHRLKTYAGFAIKAFLKGLYVSRDSQIILTSIQPIFIGPIGWMIAAIRKAPFLLEVRDIWPDALEVKGAIKSKVALAGLYGLSNFLYRHAFHVVSITPGIADELFKKGLAPEKIDVLPNGLDPDLFPVVNIDREKTRNKLGWSGQFVAVYVGVHTEVTAMDTIVEAAKHLKSEPNVRFEIYGSGSTTAIIKKMIVEYKLENCRLNGTVPKKQVPTLLAAADVCLMCLFESPLIHIYFQNKFFDYLGAGKPIVAAFRGHQRQIMEAHGLDTCVDPFDSQGLAETILRLSKDPVKCKALGQRGRQLASAQFCLDDILERYYELIINITDYKQPPKSRFSYQPGIFLPTNHHDQTHT